MQKNQKQPTYLKSSTQLLQKGDLLFFPCAGSQHPSVPVGLSGGRRCVHDAEVFSSLSSPGSLTSSLQLHNASLEWDTAPHLLALGEWIIPNNWLSLRMTDKRKESL